MLFMPFSATASRASSSESLTSTKLTLKVEGTLRTGKQVNTTFPVRSPCL